MTSKERVEIALLELSQWCDRHELELAADSKIEVRCAGTGDLVVELISVTADGAVKA